MKFKSYIIPGLLSGAFALSMIGCTDDFEEVNSNPNKVYSVELGDLWSGTVKRSMDFFSEVNYNRLFNFSRSIIVQYSTNPSQDTGDSYFKKFYVEIMRDLINLERRYSQNPETYGTRLAIIKTWKSYCFYYMCSLYGPIPMSDAISDGSENKRYYAYDSEKEIYTAILKDLDEAYTLFENGAPVEALEMDPVFGNGGAADLGKWKRFSNSLRLNVAMHVQNLDSDLARENALAALGRDLFISNDDNVNLNYGTTLENSASWYYNRFIYNQSSFSQSSYPALSEYLYIYVASFNDPRLEAMFLKSNAKNPSPTSTVYVYTDTITRPHACGNNSRLTDTYCSDYKKHQADGLNEYRRDSLTIEITSPYVPFCELNSIPTGWQWANNPADVNGTRFTDPLWKYQGEYNPSFIQDRYVDETSSLTLLTYADVCFLQAEAEIIFKGNAGAAQGYYEQGIRAAMERAGVTDYADYMKRDGIKWGTSYAGFHDRRMLYQAKIDGANGTEGLLEQVYKQRWFADIMIPLEQWNMERRTRALDFPPFFLYNASVSIDGVNSTYNYWTERLIYPNAEHIKNAAACAEGVQKLQAASPYYRTEREGDNIFTSLGIAKKIPNIETADETWGRSHTVFPRLEYWHHQWGATYDEVVESAKAYTGNSNASLALGLVKFKINSKKVYDTPDMPEIIDPEEDEEL
ncbi:MAG: SusD/RagB family nutrient-binding outer membrane lipoprotein [Bacteroides sp.]|nr:SusD/RagB family nutrient-binding outer membrane lipoprotein [Bacteroides sp.]